LVLVGNAGGIDIVSNGRPAGRIGPRGQVRVITVTPEGVHVAEPRKKQPRDDS
jgi:hypothetical protein